MTSPEGLGRLGALALSRGTVDRVTIRRNDQGWIAAWEDPRTRVLWSSAGQALVR